MTCQYCNGESEIEADNNGPIGPWPVCGPSLKSWQENRAWDAREQMNAQGRKLVAEMNARQGQR